MPRCFQAIHRRPALHGSDWRCPLTSGQRRHQALARTRDGHSCLLLVFARFNWADHSLNVTSQASSVTVRTVIRPSATRSVFSPSIIDRGFLHRVHPSIYLCSRLGTGSDAVLNELQDAQQKRPKVLERKISVHAVTKWLISQIKDSDVTAVMPKLRHRLLKLPEFAGACIGTPTSVRAKHQAYRPTGSG